MHVYIHLKVATGAKREMFKKVSETHYVVAVKEPAERNQANRRILELLKEKLDARRVRLISGHHKDTKVVDIGVV